MSTFDPLVNISTWTVKKKKPKTVQLSRDRKKRISINLVVSIMFLKNIALYILKLLMTKCLECFELITIASDGTLFYFGTLKPLGIIKFDSECTNSRVKRAFLQLIYYKLIFREFPSSNCFKTLWLNSNNHINSTVLLHYYISSWEICHWYNKTIIRESCRQNH